MWERLKSLVGLSSAPRAETWSFGVGHGDKHDVLIHAASSPRIVILLPGHGGSIDGYAGKYRVLADHLRARGVGAVVRSANTAVHGQAFEVTCRNRARDLIEGTIARGAAICGQEVPELLLLGVSAGASAFAAEAAKHPQVRRMLLLAPSYDAGRAAVAEGLLRFQGELYVVVGADDEVVGDLPRQLVELASSATRRELRVIEGCDHMFRGEVNGRVLSHAPLWAFLGEGDGPDPARGIKLYD
jgi:pimeloyl-ACP methyl ester carboxylesterase